MLLSLLAQVKEWIRPKPGKALRVRFAAVDQSGLEKVHAALLEHYFAGSNEQYLSSDEGRSWSAGRTVWPHPASYSDLATLQDSSIGIIYERAEKGSTHYWDELHFARFSLDWLTPPAAY